LYAFFFTDTGVKTICPGKMGGNRSSCIRSNRVFPFPFQKGQKGHKSPDPRSRRKKEDYSKLISTKERTSRATIVAREKWPYFIVLAVANHTLLASTGTGW
jgi:hypothetical protein